MERILSVGIDMGTTTTHLVFSQLSVQNVSLLVSSPKIRITGVDVQYRSSIHLTPLTSEHMIDVEAAKRLIEKEYELAGISPQEVHTGAVIITGESAGKENAKEVLRALSRLAGDFVVATAGPVLESILAAKGAGTPERSRRDGLTIANIDIGGGTTNIAVYQAGRLVGTTCLRIGGRMLRFDKDGTLLWATDDARRLAQSLGFSLHEGLVPPREQLEQLSALLARLIAGSLDTPGEDEALRAVMVGDPLPAIRLKAISFSGGVSVAMDTSEHENPFRDLGHYLARAILAEPGFARYERIEVKDRIRATVLGAGCHATSLSGSTIQIDDGLLPLQDILIVGLEGPEESLTPSELAERITGRCKRIYQEHHSGYLALGLRGDPAMSYRDLSMLAKGLVLGLQQVLGPDKPMIVAVRNDIAKALGRAMRSLIGDGRKLICIDGIEPGTGDHIDIGRPFAGSTTVPVIMKTMVFEQNRR